MSFLDENRDEQYYPTYTFKDKSVLILEFEKAYEIANDQTKLYGQISNILIAIITALITILTQFGFDSNFRLKGVAAKYSLPFSFLTIVFGLVLLRYFVELQRQIIFNTRKVITLRKLLGIDYGKIHLTLPNWRLEGASNPFVIRLFPGWFSFACIPFWILLITINIIWFFCTYSSTNNLVNSNWYFGSIIITLIYFWVFRWMLNDRHETIFLHLTKLVSKLLRIKLVHDFEYIIYRCKLSVIELYRLKFTFGNLKEIAVQIEDKKFFSHRGVNYRSIIRAILSRFKVFRKKKGYVQSGGSTITMQIVRTLFIKNLFPKYRRKVIEILLSIWIEKQFTKGELIDMYLSSVRFEKGIFGLAEATKYFFSSAKRNFSNEEAFFLIERLSSITSRYNRDRVNYLIKQIEPSLNAADIHKLYSEKLEKSK